MASTTPSKTILVTGSTSGIGLATVRQLAAQGHTLLCHGRSKPKIDALVQEIREAGVNAHGYRCDFSDLDDVRATSAAIADAHPDLSVLVNNAGCWNPRREASHQGHELTFAANHLAPFLLTQTVLPVLEANSGRVVTVASELHARSNGRLDDIQNLHPYKGLAAYNHSKLANVLFAFELARRSPSVTSNALHPGGVNTNLTAGKGGIIPWILTKIVVPIAGMTPDKGARTSVHLAISQAVEGVTGQYFDKCTKVASSPESMDENLAEQLWDLSERLVSHH